MEDEAIVALYWQRDESAIRETDAKYGRYLAAIAYNILADREDSRESVSETYFRAWGSIPPQRPGILASYLARITRRLSIDVFRRRRSQKRQGSEYALSLTELEECVSGGEDPATAAERRALAEAVTAWLRTQPVRTRRIFLCRYFYGDPLRAIARWDGSSEAAVKSALHRARLSLREHLEQGGFCP